MTARRRPLLRERAGADPLGMQGLTTAEAAARRARHGANDILDVAGGGWGELARDTLRDPMLWFLVGTGLLYLGLGDRLEAATMLAALLPLAGMDAVLHRRTHVATEGLRGRLATRASVLRDGAELDLPAVDVVPGDLVLVAAGEAFPADGIVVAGAELQAEESSLTGESLPVRKQPLAVVPAAGEAPPIEERHWALAGTRLLTGRARVRVVFTGADTLYGELVRSAVGGRGLRTPLQQAVARLVGALVLAAAVLCALLAAVRLWQGHGWVDALLSAATLAMAALPEEYPLVLTMFLGLGVRRLARRRALVRRAVSVENIGRVTCICSDKTGTITDGRLRLTHLLPAAGLSEDRLVTLAAAASRPEAGDPLDATVAAAMTARGLAPPARRLATFPFTEARQRETAVVELAGEGAVCVVKGASEVVLAMVDADEGTRAAWSGRAATLAAEGHKVLACAWRALDAAPAEEPARGYALAGLLAFEDPVRDGVAAAIRACADAGLHAIMVTGDHPATARAIAREVGLGGDEPVVVTGDEVATRVERGEGTTLRRIDVVARALPAQKLALVRALQEAGEIVAVTGDGVNDVPALQAADVGIAMGERGTRSAREAASIVLLDDDFATIVGAIAEGRRLFAALRVAFQYLLAVHVPFVVSAALVPLLGHPSLYLPVHVVWLELVIHPTAILVFQDLPPRGRPTGRPDRRARLFARGELLRVTVVSLLLTTVVVAAYLAGETGPTPIAHARAMALAALSLASAALVAALAGLRPLTARIAIAATIGLALVLLQVPPLASRLHVTPLALREWLLLAAACAIAVAPLGLPRR